LKILVALGGNAILKRTSSGTADEQLTDIRRASKQLVELLLAGHIIAVTHGNGPQVGDILLKNELAGDTLPPMPLDVCVAESQGMIGYMLQQALYNEMKLSGLEIPVATVLTQTLVDQNDPAFKNPMKPIGPFYSATEASKLKEAKGWSIVNDSGRGYRRVVPSPNPVSIVEEKVIKEMFNSGNIIISVGGGGIPVIRDHNSGSLHGVEAVIDKDLSAAVLATTLGVDALLLLTDVDGVFMNYGESNQRLLSRMNVEECMRYLRQGVFPAGSMGPKVEASLRFVVSGGKTAIIASLDRAKEAIEGKTGTTIVKS